MPTLHLRIWHLGIGFGVLAVIAVALAGVWYFLFRSHTAQVGLRPALAVYRQGRDGIARGLGPEGALRLDVGGVEHAIALADAHRL